MLDGQPILNLSVYISGIALCFLGIMMICVFGKTIEKSTRLYFTIFFLCLATDLGLNTAAELLSGDPPMRAAMNVIHFLHQFFSPVLAYITLMYLLGIIRKNKSVRGYYIGTGILFTIFVGSLLLCQPGEGYFYIDASAFFHRGRLYIYSVAVSCLPLLLNIFILIREGRLLTAGERKAFWIYSAIPAAAVVIQVFIKGAHLVIPATIIAALTMFIFIISERTKIYYEQQQKQTQLTTAIMLSQIQPHFLYNTLGIIQNLCYKNPAAAEEAVAKFSRYLRQNIDSLSNEDTIPFTQELSHTKNYLDLEKLRFEDMLDIRYEINCDAFRLPPLTLQPIAENAVLHGVRNNPRGEGTVIIRTEETDEAYQISVIDNGPGFDPKKLPDDGQSHIGIMNVRKRLQIAVGGVLDIDSTVRKGTTVRIIIPKKGGKQ